MKTSYVSDEEIRWLYIGLHIAAATAGVVLAVEKNRIIYRAN